MNTVLKRFAILAVLVPGILAGCASESHRTLEIESVAARSRPYSGPREPLAVAGFANRSSYMNGVFSDGTDRLGSQARTILKTHLAQTGRFAVLDRDNLETLGTESSLAGREATVRAAGIVVGGEVTEFGRRETGDRTLFGIAGRGKSQVAYAKVSLNLLDVATSEVVYAVQGAAEYELSEREILGTGGTSGYDSTLNGKVLNLAIMDAVNRLVEGMETGEWSPAPAR